MHTSVHFAPPPARSRSSASARVSLVACRRTMTATHAPGDGPRYTSLHCHSSQQPVCVTDEHADVEECRAWSSARCCYSVSRPAFSQDNTDRSARPPALCDPRPSSRIGGEQCWVCPTTRSVVRAPLSLSADAQVGMDVCLAVGLGLGLGLG